MKKREVKIDWYSDPSEAESDLLAEAQEMNPNERVQEAMRLMELVGGWSQDGRLSRTARFVKVA